MNILVCIDDTDNLESRGTGQLSQSFAETIKNNGWGCCSNITRHQLFVHKDIPYTSHNSAMCFEAQITDTRLEDVTDLMQKGLEAESAPGSDPGLCIAVNNNGLDKQPLMSFGKNAKQTVLNKAAAYELGASLGVHLSEHGGTGDGIIGALAGIGLRLGGNDGRFRGWYHFDKTGTCMTAREFCMHDFVDQVQTIDGHTLAPDDIVMLGADKVKIIYKNGGQILPVEENPKNRKWITLTKDRVKQIWP